MTASRWSRSFLPGTRSLFAAWGVYWAALLLISGRMLLRVMAVGARAPHGHGGYRAVFEGDRFHLEALLDGHVVEGGSMSLLALSLWIAGPPLLLWLLWLARRPRRAALAEDERRPLLPSERWTPTAYHEALRIETMREQDKP